MPWKPYNLFLLENDESKGNEKEFKTVDSIKISSESELEKIFETIKPESPVYQFQEVLFARTKEDFQLFHAMESSSLPEDCTYDDFRDAFDYIKEEDY